jgi:nucleoside 2-deoxyribosyltransferase
MNILEGKRCYLSGAIQFDQTNLNWRIKPKEVLTKEFKLNLYDPFEDPRQQCAEPLKEAQKNRDFDALTKIAKSFVRKDLAMCDRADFLIAYLPYNVATFGTTHEITESNRAKKPVLLVSDSAKEKIPLWFYGFIPTEFMFNNWEDLYVYLREVNEGLHKNNNRWWFTYNLI